MAKITPANIANSNSTVQLNQNFTDVATELNTKVLYRDNPAGEPNSMQNDLDMNSNDILNAKQVQAQSLKLNGTVVTTTSPLGTVAAEDVTYSNATSGLTATDVQAAVDEVEARLDTTEANTTTNTTNIATNASSIATNASAIAALEDPSYASAALTSESRTANDSTTLQPVTGKTLNNFTVAGSGRELVCAEAGTYALSAFVTVSTTSSGASESRISFRVNGSATALDGVVASDINNYTGFERCNLALVGQTVTLAVNDTIAVNVHNTVYTSTLAASEGRIEIRKIS